MVRQSAEDRQHRRYRVRMVTLMGSPRSYPELIGIVLLTVLCALLPQLRPFRTVTIYVLQVLAAGHSGRSYFGSPML